MEPIITPLLLASTGIKIPEDEVDDYLDDLNEQLAERIGETVVTTLDPDQVDELAKLQETKSDEEINTWLRQQIPDLDDLIQQEVDILLGEVVDSADTVNQSPATE